ncbi:MAG: VWA domain-containing protein [Chloroflexi bacterium]|nr:VWA domain-containing protein [Chloroflexota bacterium]
MAGPRDGATGDGGVAEHGSVGDGEDDALETLLDRLDPGGDLIGIGDVAVEEDEVVLRERARNDVINGVNTRPDALKIIVLLSDGVPNRCAGGASCTEAQAATYSRSQAQAAAAQGITIYTIGLGASADDALLQDLATLGNGVYVPSPTAGDLGATFDKIAALIKVKILE